MTLRTWIGQPSENFLDASAWTPYGIPDIGDTEVIQSGSAVISDVSLLGSTIIVGSTADPTLTIDGSTLGASTTIETPQTPSTSGEISASITIEGNSVLTGTLGSAVNGSGQPSVLNLEVLNTSSMVENQGIINIAPDQRTYLSGAAVLSDGLQPGGAELNNNGVINVYGTIAYDDLSIYGNGTINLDEVSNGLGLPATPSLMQISDQPFNHGFISSGQNVFFNGGHLALGTGSGNPGDGMFWNFAGNPDNLIQLQDFTLSSDIQTGNTVTLTGDNNTKTVTLNFGSLPTTTGELYYVPDGSSLDVVWHVYPVDPTPIHPTPTPPGGHKLI